MRDNRDQDYLEQFTYDADSGGEDFMGGQELSPASINLPAEVAPAMSAGFFSGIAGLPPEIAAAIAQLIAAQAAGTPAEVAPGMAAGEAEGIAKLVEQSIPDEVAPAISGQETGISKLVEQSEGPTKQPYTFDELNQMLGQVKNAPSISDEVAPGMAPASVGGLPAEVAPAMAAGQGSGIAELLAAPAAAPAATPAAPIRSRRSEMYSDNPRQGYGIVPVYAPQSRMDRMYDDFGQPLEPELLGYEFNPIAAGLTIEDAPKPAAILAEEKRIGKPMEATYATFTSGPANRGGETIAYGPPTGYRYDNGQSQYVKFDSSGNYYETEKRKGDFDDALKMAALFAAITTGGASLGLGGAGAGAAGTAAAAFTPEMIAAGLTPGSIGAAGAASGALTGANLAAASGIGSLGAGAATLGGLTAEQIAASDLAAYAPAEAAVGTGAAESLAGAASLTPEALAASELAAYAPASLAGETAAGITSLTPEALAASELSAYPTASLATEAAAGAGGAGTLTAEQLAASELAAYQPASLAGNTGISSLGGSGSLFDAAASPLASGYSPSITALTNEAVASGTFTPGSLGSSMAAAGTLSPEALAAAAGVTTAGATPALVELGRAGKGLTSANEAVASGLGPGSAGAKAAVEGTLTAQELAAAAGTAGALNKDGIGDLLTKAKDAITDKVKDASSGSGSGMGVLGLMALMSMMNKGGGPAPASTATIPELTATRTQLPYDVDKKGVNPNTPYRPGQGGVTYFSPTTYTPTPKAAGGGLMSLGQSNLGSYSDGGRLLKGPGDGVSDSIPAIIGRKQPARLANGEFVIPARIVSELGNGSTDAGAKRLYEMMARVQKARRNTKNVAANTKAAKYLPA